MKGLPVMVYRTNYLQDCTNNGLSAKFDRLILVGDGIDPVSKVCDERPALKLVFHKGIPYAEPTFQTGEGYSGWMFGGNFIYSTDSRFPSKQPIKVFDRRESWESQKLYD